MRKYKSTPEVRLKDAERKRKQWRDNKTFVQRYKRYCGCQICGENEPVALDLHHLDPTEKEANPGDLYSRSRNIIKREIRKCTVLCANCHRKVHAGKLTL